ncbi:MAG: hypothetical protein ACTSXC_07570 [Candidatus Freyarchaeota archaeon]
MPTPFKCPVCGEELEGLVITSLGIPTWLKSSGVVGVIGIGGGSGLTPRSMETAST